MKVHSEHDRLLVTQSGVQLASQIRTQEISSLEVVEAHIAQIKRVNPRINAMVRDRFEQARTEAQIADEQVRTGNREELPIYHGVPCSIKECFSLQGMPNTGGLVARKGLTAATDAITVHRLRQAGAIPLGVTNLSELCMWMESANKVYGRTRNPYDPRRIVGGSSGGEAAIIAAGGAPFGLGSDIGGSIRMPAFFNGIFGHKPTGGLIPNTDQFPVAVNQALWYMTTGPLARHAKDLWPLIKILAGPESSPPASQLQLGNPTQVSIADLSIISVESNGLIKVHPDLLNAQRLVAQALERFGAKVSKVTIPNLKHSPEIWATMLAAAGGPTFGTLLGNGTPVSPLKELIRWCIGGSDHTFPAIGLAALEKLMPTGLHTRRKYMHLGYALRQELVDRIGPAGVMLYPSYPRPAPRHHVPLLHPIWWIYTAILNMMELPVTQVPLGLNGQGLPLGVQVAAVHGNDHYCVAVALALEQAFGGWRPPRGFF